MSARPARAAGRVVAGGRVGSFGSFRARRNEEWFGIGNSGGAVPFL
jgi:hypothetical protein